MTRATNARIAGLTFLLYIAAGMASMVLFRRATAGEGIGERLAAVAGHASDVGFLVLLGFLQCFSALVLAVTLYAITHEQDEELAMLGLACRVGEGVIAGLSIPGMPALLSLATVAGAGAPAAHGTHALAGYLLRQDVALPGTFFAVGSALFAWLLLCGRMIPLPLAWLGVLASVLLVVGLPLRFAGFLEGRVTTLMWLPMLAFEVPLALWLLTRGVAEPSHGTAAS